MNAFFRRKSVLEEKHWVVLNSFFTPILQLAMMTETSARVERRKSVDFHSVFHVSENNRLKVKTTDQSFGYWNKSVVPSLDVRGVNLGWVSTVSFALSQMTDLLGFLNDNKEMGVFQQVRLTLARSSLLTLVESRNLDKQPYEKSRALWKEVS